MPTRWIHGALLALAGLMIAYMGLFFVREASKAARWAATGVIDSSFQTRSDSLAIFQRVEPSDFPLPPRPQAGDTVLALNDSLRTLPEMVLAIEHADPPGRRYKLAWSGAAGPGSGVAVTRPVRPGETLSIVFLTLLRAVIALAFAGVGLWAALWQPESRGVRALLLFSLSMAAFMCAAVQVLSSTYAAFSIPGMKVIQTGLSYLGIGFSAFWLHLLLLFPRPLSRLRGRQWPVWLVCYAPLIVLQSLLRLQPAWQGVLGGIIFLVMLGQVLGGLLRLWWCVRHAHSPLERRQGTLVLMGSGPGMFLLILLIVLFNFFSATVGAWSQAATLWVLSLVLLVVLLSPLSTAWALGRYRLLEVEGRLKRGTRYLLLAALLLAGLLALIYGAARAVLDGLGISSPGQVVLVALLLAVAAVPLQRLLLQRLERWVFPERHRLKDMVQGFHERMIAMPDRASLWRHLEERLMAELDTASVVPVLKEGEGTVCPSCQEPTPFRADSSLIPLLAGLASPLPLDELLASRRVRLEPAEVDWLRERHVALLLPLRVPGGSTGFLAMGAKRDGEDYTGEEMRALATLASQVALAAENLRLLEENLEKRRLGEQLAMARKIQHQFLPQSLPPTPGLEVVARSLFCLEVAGDYYDVITLEDGRTVLAVGDVSGKGAGAAMLMANLQASLRTALRLGDRLEEIVAGINQLICGNTGDEQFITFFVGAFDPGAGRLDYVNAGHNPPLVIRADGSTTALATGGLLLGVLPGAAYERGSVDLLPGDLLLLYTDGLSEALDEREEEFGEERVIRLLHAQSQRSPAELLALLEEEARRFQGREAFADDFTLLIGRVTA